MAETLMTYEQWIAALADNDTGEIGAQDIKDALFSMHHSWFGMAKRLASDQTIAATPTKITMNAGNEGLGQEPGYSGANDRLTIQSGGGGTYMVFFGCSIKKLSGTSDFVLKVYKNGVWGSSFGPNPKGTGSGDWSCVSGVTIWNGVAVNDYFELWADFSTGSDNKVNEAYLHMQRIR
jgi:hypothetical protein